MENFVLKNIFEKYGTPTFVFDEGALRKRVMELRKIMGERVHLCYSIKANPFFIPAMRDVIDKFEVCSPGELSICEHYDIDGKQIIYSGVNKEISDITCAYEDKVGIFTAESKLHVKYINEVGEKNNTSIPVLLRLNAGSQFGMSKEDLLEVIRDRDKYKGITIIGIHYFAGTQRRKLDSQIAELAMLADLYDEIKDKYGLVLEKIEYGPGFCVPYFEKDDFSDTLKPAKELAESLKALSQKVDLTIEMGRFYTAECGYYLTKVMDLKNNRGDNIAIVDGGMNHLNYYGQMMGMKIPRIKHFKTMECKDENTVSSEKWSLYGSLCTTADIIAKNVEFTNLSIGDILCFENTGAYTVTEGIYLFLSRQMPRIVLYKEDGTVELARDILESWKLNVL